MKSSREFRRSYLIYLILMAPFLAAVLILAKSLPWWSIFPYLVIVYLMYSGASAMQRRIWPVRRNDAGQVGPEGEPEAGTPGTGPA